MKLKLIILFSLVVFICSAQTRRALLVGVANYPQESGWRKIHSDNDVQLLSKLFTPDGVKVSTLIDKEATFNGIQQALTKIESQSQPGDTIILHFSCHGQQVYSEDSQESDSLDEALIPYDAKVQYGNGYTGDKHLTDDNLSKSVNRVRQKVGKEGLVLVLLDACHSGDSFKGDEQKNTVIIRGGYPVFTKHQGITPRNHKSLNEFVSIPRAKDLSDVIYISACQSYQVNAEMSPDGQENYGSLTYAFYETYNQEGLKDLHKFCSSVRNNVMRYNRATRQCPEFASTIEGLIPSPNTTHRCKCEQACDEDKCSTPCSCTEASSGNVYYYIIPGILVLLFLIIACFIWKRK